MKLKFAFIGIFALFLIALACNTQDETEDNFSKTVKVALRSVGNDLLLTNNDSTSLVFPVIELEKNTYQLTFQSHLSILPNDLVKATSKNLELANLPKDYIVEVLNCESETVAYSFQIKNTVEEDIIPCLGRNLPLNCYSIHLIFLKKSSVLNSKTNYILIGLLLLTAILFMLFNKNRNSKSTQQESIAYTKIGHYKFYQNQNKLVKDAIEIKLSVKECELMHLFSRQQNQVIKRDVIIKEIWEDNGVFVGRSLDTFISKLRKKFKDDASINIINVHGVGYKLEVS